MYSVRSEATEEAVNSLKMIQGPPSIMKKRGYDQSNGIDGKEQESMI